MNLPQPIPRAEFDRVACLWDLAKASESEFLKAWNAIPLTERQNADFDTARLGGEIAALDAKQVEARRNARLATEELEQSFPWLSGQVVHLHEIGCDVDTVSQQFQKAIVNAWQHSRRDRIASLVAAWNPLKGSETVSPPVSGWALNVRTQQAFKILRASPTGRKVRAVGVDGVVLDLKPCVVHGSAVGSGRAAPSTGGWVSCSEELGEMVWALYRDRAEFLAAHPAIV
jgi:hypothetical protein